MRKARFTDEQMVAILPEADREAPAAAALDRVIDRVEPRFASASILTQPIDERDLACVLSAIFEHASADALAG